MLRRLIIAVCLSLTVPVAAQEILTLTTPKTSTATTCKVQDVDLNLVTPAITATVLLDTGSTIQVVYGPTGLIVNSVLTAATPTGATLLHALNTGNFTTNSLVKQVYTRLNTDGVCVGTVSGTPQH